jgi:hypothetical protein
VKPQRFSRALSRWRSVENLGRRLGFLERALLHQDGTALSKCIWVLGIESDGLVQVAKNPIIGLWVGCRRLLEWIPIVEVVAAAHDNRKAHRIAGRLTIGFL